VSVHCSISIHTGKYSPKQLKQKVFEETTGTKLMRLGPDFISFFTMQIRFELEAGGKKFNSHKNLNTIVDF